MLKTKDSGVGGNVFGGKFDHRVSKVLIMCIFLDSAILSRGIQLKIVVREVHKELCIRTQRVLIRTLSFCCYSWAQHAIHGEGTGLFRGGIDPRGTQRGHKLILGPWIEYPVPGALAERSLLPCKMEVMIITDLTEWLSGLRFNK